MDKRIVITGLGVVSPNGVGLDNFTNALKNGTSGIEYYKDLKELGFSCCIGGIPNVSEELKRNYFTELQLKNFNSSGILYGCMAGMDAWKDAGLSISDNTDFESGTIFGAGTSGVEKFREAIYKLDDKKVRRLGSTVVAQTMASGVSAYLGGNFRLRQSSNHQFIGLHYWHRSNIDGFRSNKSWRCKTNDCWEHKRSWPLFMGGF